MEGKTAYTTKEAAKYFGISPATIYRMEKQGLISPIKKQGGQKQFSKKNIAQYLKEHHGHKAVPNISKRKKRDLIIKEKEAIYTA